MPNFGVHLAGGAVVGVIFLIMLDKGYFSMDFPTTVMAMLVIFLYSVFPDVDQQGSSARELIFGMICLGICLAAWYDMKWIVMGMALFMWGVMWFTAHRGIFHSMMLGVIVSAPWALHSIVLAMGAAAAYASHLLLDKLTKKNKFPY